MPFASQVLGGEQGPGLHMVRVHLQQPIQHVTRPRGVVEFERFREPE